MSNLSVKGSGRSFVNPGVINDGDEAAFSLAVPGAELGDFVLSSWSRDIFDLQLTASVTSAGTVEAVFSNSTSGGVDLPWGHIRVAVIDDAILT